jgi:branched-chain amino acid transport system ATP-binding protein
VSKAYIFLINNNITYGILRVLGMALLCALNITKTFGALKAIDDVSFDVNEKEILALIGPNGAGKTTLLNIISGYLKPDRGKVIFKGIDITAQPPHKICRYGIVKTHQIPRPFLSLTVYENILVSSMYCSSNQREGMEIALDFLKKIGLYDRLNWQATTLNTTQRKLLEIARCLAATPKLLLLDEPLSGLSQAQIDYAKKIIQGLRNDYGITIVWVEHVIHALKGVVDRVIVLNYGKKIAEGGFEEVMENESVKEAYLGGLII